MHCVLEPALRAFHSSPKVVSSISLGHFDEFSLEFERLISTTKSLHREQGRGKLGPEMPSRTNVLRHNWQWC